MDARGWGQENPSFADLSTEIITPIGDRINCRISNNIGDTVDIDCAAATAPGTGKYTVFECEVGSYLIRAGKAKQFTMILASTTADTIQLSPVPHNYKAGEGPFRLGFLTSAASGPALTFQQIGGGNDKLIRATGSWATDGFSGTSSIWVERTKFNNGGFTAVALSTTTNANDTLEFAGDVFTNESVAAQVGFVGLGKLPIATPGFSIDQDYWVAPVSQATFRPYPTRDLALAGSITGAAYYDVTAGQIGAIRWGGNLGPYVTPGFSSSNPLVPTVSSVNGESTKLLRTGESVIVTATALAIRALEAGSVLKWWNVG